MPDRGRAFVGQRPVDALLAGGTALDLVLACEGGPEAEALQDRLGCRVLALEDRLGRRRVWSNATVASALECLADDNLTALGGTSLLTYSSSPGLLATARRVGARLRAPSPRLKALLDDKLAVRRALAGLGLDPPEFLVASAREMSFEAAAERLGVPFVVQRRVGSAGVGSWIVDDPSRLDAVRSGTLPWERLLWSRHRGAVTINIHATVADGVICVSPPSVQVTGVPELCDAAAVYAGNDFGAARELEPKLRDRVVVQTKAIGRWIGGLGYRGVFGVDFASDGVSVSPLEINPRLQGSSWLLAELERADERLSLADLNEAVWDGGCLAESAKRYSSAPLEGSSIVAHRKIDGSHRPTGLPGIYAVEPDRPPIRRSEGHSPAECAVDEVAIGGLPAPGVGLDPGAVIARLSAPRSLSAPDGRALSPEGSRALAALRRASAGDPCAVS